MKNEPNEPKQHLCACRAIEIDARTRLEAAQASLRMARSKRDLVWDLPATVATMKAEGIAARGMSDAEKFRSDALNRIRSQESNAAFQLEIVGEMIEAVEVLNPEIGARLRRAMAEESRGLVGVIPRAAKAS